MIHADALENVWSRKLDAALKQPCHNLRAKRVFCAFNAITDAVVHYDRSEYENELKKCNAKRINAKLKTFSPERIETIEDFFTSFINVFSRGKALELLSLNDKLFEWFKLHFEGKERIGGQAGIISNQLAQLEVNTVFYSPILSEVQCRLAYTGSLYFPKIINERLVYMKPTACSNVNDPTKTNWIFEFSKGDKLEFGNKEIVCPRSNRLIVASRPEGYVPIFSNEVEPYLHEMGHSFDIFFLAGFQSMQRRMGKRHFRFLLSRLVWQLKLLRNHNRGRFHLEYVAIHDPILDKVIYPRLLPLFDSLGINEVETIHFLKRIGDYPLAEKLEKHESAMNFYSATLRLFHKFKLKRLHAHTLGYFVLLMRKEYVGRKAPQDFVNSLLFASRVADARALKGGAPFYEDLSKLSHLNISHEGLTAIKEFASEFFRNKEEAKRFMLNGVYEADDHFLIMVPTAIVKPKATVGLGDTISSVAFASEPF